MTVCVHMKNTNTLRTHKQTKKDFDMSFLNLNLPPPGPLDMGFLKNVGLYSNSGLSQNLAPLPIPILQPTTAPLVDKKAQDCKVVSASASQRRRKKPRLCEGMVTFTDCLGRVCILPQGFVPISLEDLVKLKAGNSSISDIN